MIVAAPQPPGCNGVGAYHARKRLSIADAAVSAVAIVDFDDDSVHNVRAIQTPVHDAVLPVDEGIANSHYQRCCVFVQVTWNASGALHCGPRRYFHPLVDNGLT